MTANVWTFLTALAIGVPSCVAAYYGHKNSRDLKTTNDKTVGTMLSEVHAKESLQSTEFETHSEPANP